MMDVINAGLDPHRWFAGVMTKVISPDLKNKNDPQWVADTKKLQKEKVPDSDRQKAKAANFGFPGALGVDTFYRNCREGGTKITRDEAEFMRDAWINTFTEMKQHMNPEEMIKDKNKIQESFGIHSGIDFGSDVEEEDEADDRMTYSAKLPCGQIRNRCSFNAACNTQFQGTTAVGAKLAGWNLVLHGYGDRQTNFVHDEYLYCLYPYELRPCIPQIEELMIAGMRTVIPDVKVGVESSVMLHWDKKAVTFQDLKWDENGLPIQEEPHYVKNILMQRGLAANNKEQQ